MSSCSRSLQIASVMKMPIRARLSDNMAWNWEVWVARIYPAAKESIKWGCVGLCGRAGQRNCKQYSGSKKKKKNPDVPSD